MTKNSNITLFFANSSIRTLDGALSGATNSGHSEPGCPGNERLLPIPQVGWFRVKSGHSLGVSYPSVEMYLVDSTALGDWAAAINVNRKCI